VRRPRTGLADAGGGERSGSGLPGRGRRRDAGLRAGCRPRRGRLAAADRAPARRLLGDAHRRRHLACLDVVPHRRARQPGPLPRPAAPRGCRAARVVPHRPQARDVALAAGLRGLQRAAPPAGRPRGRAAGDVRRPRRRGGERPAAGRVHHRALARRHLDVGPVRHERAGAAPPPR
jgi:hypothetical protein